MPEPPVRKRTDAKSSALFRVLIVDDHPVVVAGLQALVDAESDLSVCGSASTVPEALRLADDLAPDLVVVDLSLEAGSGLDLVRTLVGRELRVLVVTMRDEPSWAERTMGMGALGYVHKSEATREIVRAIRNAMEGRPYVSSSMSEKLLRRMVGSTGRAATGLPGEVLSNRELEILERIGRGQTTQQIGEDLGLSAKTVQTYRQRIKEKLRIETAAGLAERAVRWVVESDAKS